MMSQFASRLDQSEKGVYSITSSTHNEHRRSLSGVRCGCKNLAELAVSRGTFGAARGTVRV